MDDNPNEGEAKQFTVLCTLLTDILSVVSMLIVNSYDNILPSAYDAVFSSAGLNTMAYAPSNATVAETAWPTLGTLINSGKRLVVFLTTQADYQTVPYLIDGILNPFSTYSLVAHSHIVF